MKISRTLSLAMRGAQRGGQRSLLAILSVAFGVMSLVAMSTLSNEVTRVLLVDPRFLIGGDAQLWRESEMIPAAALEEIQQLETDGKIATYTTAAVSSALVLQTMDSGHVTFLNCGVGIDPASYPLLGEISLDPSQSSAKLAEVLQTRGDAVLTGDVAQSLGLSVGDIVQVTNRVAGAPVELRLAGIATDTPAHHGERLYYSLETAEMVTGHTNPVTDLYLLWKGDSATTLAELQEAGWRSRSADAMGPLDDQMRATFNFMLKGAGLLGLIVGGIGIANMMQVLLSRRKEEVAIFKSVGYSRRDMVFLFLSETAIIGLVGSVLGVAVAALLSWGLVTTVCQIVNLFLTWHFDPLLALSGIGVGMVTTGIFALHAILQISEVRPASLFRDLPAAGRGGWRRTLALLGLLALPFAAIASLVLNSVLQGVGALLLSLAGLIALGALLGGIMWVALRLLPTFRFHLLRMARNNMRRRGFSLIFAMIAIFVGVFTLGMAITIISVSMDEYAQHTFSKEGYNLILFADSTQEETVRQAMQVHPIDSVSLRYELPAESVLIPGMAAAEGSGVLLQGRGEQLWDVTVEGAAWASQADGAYLPADAEVPTGTELLVTARSGRQRTLTVVGTYTPVEWNDGLLPPSAADGILVSKELLFELDPEDVSIQAAGEAPPSALADIGETLGNALPEAAVITSIDVDNLFSSTLQNLLVFALLMAGLALAAGAVLIANAVSLAMIERQYEIGVLKAVGYSRWQVLKTIAMEYGLIAMIASVTGLLGVELFVLVVQFVEKEVGDLLHVDLATGSLIVLVGAGITVLTALIAASKPTRLRPIEVLNRKT